ncbi:hypothetical protein WMY93_025764 [Mugilogobius chulae]|uniref:LINE-1 type transposase domain-containing 1 n=1 Tax=Mugilogobius chulae TaxID=88201 RepID=A0AAW0N6I8_9GOBI
MADHLDIADALRQLQVDLTSHFDSKIGELQSTLITMNGSITTLSEQVSLIEHRISANEDKNSFLQDKVDDLENRSCSSNLRFLQIPERAEGRDTVDFIQRLIVLLLVKILHLAREKGELLFEGTKVFIYPDYSATPLEKRRMFDPVKRQLREKNLQYSLRYPAVLRVNIDGKFTQEEILLI